MSSQSLPFIVNGAVQQCCNTFKANRSLKKLDTGFFPISVQKTTLSTFVHVFLFKYIKLEKAKCKKRQVMDKSFWVQRQVWLLFCFNCCEMPIVALQAKSKIENDVFTHLQSLIYMYENFTSISVVAFVFTVKHTTDTVWLDKVYVNFQY